MIYHALSVKPASGMRQTLSFRSRITSSLAKSVYELVHPAVEGRVAGAAPYIDAWGMGVQRRPGMYVCVCMARERWTYRPSGGGLADAEEGLHGDVSLAQEAQHVLVQHAPAQLGLDQACCS